VQWVQEMTNEQLTDLYNEANGLDPKEHNPITTERIFAAMRAAIAAEREECAKVCEKFTNSKSGHPFPEGWDAACAKNASDIRMRSNAGIHRAAEGRPVE